MKTFKVGTVDVPDAPEEYHEMISMYSGYAFYDSYRRVCLAACKELVRAGASLQNQKLTVDRIDDLAHVHPSYLDFLTRHLLGRSNFEREHLSLGGGFAR